MSRKFLHNFAVKGFGETNVQKYNLGRPDFPVESIKQIGSILTTYGKVESNHLDILELGSGTGKFTNSFLRNIDIPIPIKYTATEPSKAFRSSLTNLNLGINVLEGTGEKIPANNESLDAVLVAQAFHWMANEKTLNEVHRVLRPKKPFIMIWNMLDLSIDWIKELELDLLSSYFDKTSPRYLTGEWRNVWSADYAKLNYAELKYHNSKFSHFVNEQQVIDRILSVSAIAMLNQNEQKTVEDKIKLILRKYFPNKPEQYEFVYSTDIAWTLKN